MFRLRGEYEEAINGWRDRITSGGQRPLVAIHVRRGDYRRLQSVPQFRLVPENWYLALLRAIWPNLNDPVLFVATDEPQAMLPAFADFRPVTAKFSFPGLSCSIL